MLSANQQVSGARFPRWALGVVLSAALIARIGLLASEALSFHADEAIVGLMARHIGGGARPTFFYGQAYMGSLDAWLVALGFRLLGESVLTIRLVQSALYLAVVALGFVTAWRLTRRGAAALAAGLLLAVPAPNTALYTTATLGGYNETLLLGTLVFLFGCEVVANEARGLWRWAALGLAAGLGWWVNGLIAVYALPVGLLILYRVVKAAEKRRWLTGIAVALAGFVIGGAPWWVFDFTHDHAALQTFLSSTQTGEFAGIGIPYVPPGGRAIGLVVLGLPALIGMRFPWSGDYFAPVVGLVVGVIYVAALWRVVRPVNQDSSDGARTRSRAPLQAEARLSPDGRWLVAGMVGLFGVVFVASTFGADPTGRYFLPLTLPLALAVGTLAGGLWSSGNRRRRGLAAVMVLVVLGYQAAGQVTAARSESGFTTQFDPISHFSNADDRNLVAFLETLGLNHGYSNYWITFRLAFLSGERLQYSAALPYKANLSYNAADNRYPPYVAATETSEQIAVITANLPALDSCLERRWAAEGLTYQQEQIGIFRIYHGFEPVLPLIAGTDWAAVCNNSES